LRRKFPAATIERRFAIAPAAEVKPMTDEPDAKRPSDGLQFDHVEYTTPSAAATCTACGQSIRDCYYEVNGNLLCPVCHESLQASLTGGSPFGRFVGATLYGSLAGLLGAAIYYGVREATNIDFGLISIVVGLMIGKAVRKGSDGRGGWKYQLLAVFLTYTSIVLTYIPPTIQALRTIAQKKEAAGNEKAEPAEPAAPANEGGDDADAKTPPTLAQVALALGILICLAYAIPVLVGFQSPMALIIIGVGLYEAWVINRRVRLDISGPHRIGSDPHVEPTG
jgi:hypothetical protein